MIDDFILDSLDSIDDIDTSDLFTSITESEDSYSDFFDSFVIPSDDIEADVDDANLFLDTDSASMPKHNQTDEQSDNYESHERYHISFKGNGRCSVCGCRRWAGYGDTCANCGHFYNKHI